MLTQSRPNHTAGNTGTASAGFTLATTPQVTVSGSGNNVYVPADGTNGSIPAKVRNATQDFSHPIGGAVAAEPKVRFSAKPLSVVRVPGRTDEKPLQIRAPLPRMQKHGWRGYLAVDRCTSLCWLADTNTRDHPGNCFSHIKRRFSA